LTGDLVALQAATDRPLVGMSVLTFLLLC